MKDDRSKEQTRPLVDRRPADGVIPRRASPRRLRFVSLSHLPPAVLDNGLRGMERALRRAGVPDTPSPRTAFGGKVQRALARLGLVRPIVRVRCDVYLVATGQAYEGRFCPATYFNRVVPWILDAWPPNFDRVARVLRRHRVDLAFFTARQAADHFRDTLGIDARWLPEACDPADFDPSKPLADRCTDVLELGRRHAAYHDAITPRLADRGRAHLYEKSRGQIIFPTVPELQAGYADAKISVCFPSSTTHPERSGNVETVTLRYFESLAAKCLVVGQCPAELKDLFCYDPVIAADPTDPAGQIDQLLDRIVDHQPLVDRNHARLLEVGTWDVRVRELLDILATQGISAASARARKVSE